MLKDDSALLPSSNDEKPTSAADMERKRKPDDDTQVILQAASGHGGVEGSPVSSPVLKINGPQNSGPAPEQRIPPVKRARFAEEITIHSVTRWLDRDVEQESEIQQGLQQRVFGQCWAIHVFTRTVCRGLSHSQPSTRPLASFLLVGPEGVGKLELARAYFKVLSAKSFSIFDMSGFGVAQAVSKLRNDLVDIVDRACQPPEVGHELPPSIIVFRRVEKAHPAVRDIILAIVEEGLLSNDHGKQASFKNAIICLTSHFGCQGMYEPGATYLDGTSVTWQTREGVLTGLGRVAQF